jgi:general secretion pathway protein A
MYAAHFGLEQDPFSIAPDPRYLFMSERHREALAHLLFGVSGSGETGTAQGTGTGGGFVLLTGDVGTGKTTICRCFLEQIPPGCHVAYIFNPKLSVVELLQTICEEFHLALRASASASTQSPTVKDYIDALNTFLLTTHAQGQTCVLIIDEAQNLHPDVLEQLRLLTNLETSQRKLLQIVLIGQPELRTMLQQPELAQLAQRVIARFHLDALCAAETVQYISHRLSIAGHTGPLPFDNAALRSIHRLTHGIPRRINLLCGRALLGAWAHGSARVTPAIAKRAAKEVFGAESTPSLVRRMRPASYVLAAVAVLALLLLALRPDVKLWSETAQRAAEPLAKPPSASPPRIASPAAVATPRAFPVNTTLAPLNTLLSQLPRDPNSAWETLAPRWSLSTNAAKPCDPGALAPWECYQTTGLTLPQLRQLARPGWVKLRLDDGDSAYATLVEFTDQTAQLLIKDKLHLVQIGELVRLWDGNFATYWRVPEGYRPRAQGGSTTPLFAQLARQLAQLDGVSPDETPPQSLSPGLRARVMDFQRTHGLKADGQPGPLTLMQLETAIKAKPDGAAVLTTTIKPPQRP